MVTNQTTGLVFLVDYKQDLFLGSGIGAGSGPQREYPSADRSIVLVYDDSTHQISNYNSAQEKDINDYSIGGRTESVVISSDNTRAFVAVPTYAQQDVPGAVLILDLTNGGIRSIIGSPAAQRLALSPNGSNLLVFSNDTDTFSYIDLTATTLESKAVPAVTGINRPYAAFFTSDSTAYVLNCGSGCGGSAAPSVQSIDVPSLKAGLASDPPTPPTAGTPVPVGGATVGLLDGSNLYVAGNSVSGGQTTAAFSAVSLAGATPVVSFTVNIGDGFHNIMAKSQNNKIWIGALTCANLTQGCLSVVDLASHEAASGEPLGPITGFAEVPSRNMMFVCEGGELHHYDVNTLNWTVPLDIVGYAYDVKVLDQ